ncbi:hypothetical protein QYF50_05860 [Paenibacillus vini]|uniref:hypothetical protein n=1 Tax=Paenibacillus vini TaxID=1476024 RepID=UPI0025B62FA8|nr:hypothetical protein [Paenibacillus vini]MDN4067415.1 hypothetical protein [Paenibacillus vini]
MVSFEMTPGTVALSLSGMIIILIGAAWAAVKYFTKKRLDHEFNKRLENHKADLQNIRDYNSFDLGRRLQDFNLFTTKKHSIYPELYEFLLIAEGKLSLLYNGIIRTFPDFLNMNSEQLVVYLRENNFDISDDLDGIINEWDNNKKELLQVLYGEIRNKEMNEARQAIIKAKNHFLFSRLYLSEEIAASLDQLTKTMLHYLIDKEYVMYESGPEKIEASRALGSKQEKISELMDLVKKIMQDELKIGYYDNRSKDEA